MLLELKVSNFAIIENIHIHFQKGLNILSGETGAGKSVLLKSLSLLMGLKSSTDSIRAGCKSATVEGVFDLSDRADLIQRLSDLGIEVEDHLLIVRRLITEDKSRVYLNGTLSPLSHLRELVSPLIEVAGQHSPLIEMTGQHDNRHLMSKSYHLDLLDSYAGTWPLREKFESLFMQWKQNEEKIQQLTLAEKSAAQRLDFLKYQRDEIQNLNLKVDEDIELEANIRRLKNSSKLIQFVEEAESILYNDDDSASSRLHTILGKARELHSVDPTLFEKSQQLEQAKTLIEDSVYDLRQYLNQMEVDPSQLEQLQSRWSDIRKLQKKYGPQIQDILNQLQSMSLEIQNLEGREQQLEQLQKQKRQIEKEMKMISLDLHQRRTQASGLLSDSVNAELLDLNMKGVQFKVSIQSLEQFQPTGSSDVEFLIQASQKDQPRALGKFASGGELSRILLSLKCVIGRGSHPRTFLFDEVDTGVSGPTAEKVGRKLHTIAEGQQVICVTHLPQVAAFGDTHFYIQKSPAENAVAMEVRDLKKQDRIKEIARLISGEKITKNSLAHATELLESCQA